MLCGGVSALIKAGYETLVEAGYQPESAYFEVLHELKLIVDLIYRGGLAYMRYSISDTAEFGDYVSGPRVINEASRKAMKDILREIQDGTFAKRFLADQNSGRREFLAFREAEAKHPVEIVGKQLRASMPFLDPVTVEEVAKTLIRQQDFPGPKTGDLGHAHRSFEWDTTSKKPWSCWRAHRTCSMRWRAAGPVGDGQ